MLIFNSHRNVCFYAYYSMKSGQNIGKSIYLEVKWKPNQYPNVLIDDNSIILFLFFIDVPIYCRSKDQVKCKGGSLAGEKVCINYILREIEGMEERERVWAKDKDKVDVDRFWKNRWKR